MLSNKNSYIKNVKVHYLTVSEGLEFTLNGDGNYDVTGIGTFEGTDLFIPATYNGRPVTSIAFGAFENCTQLTSVFIPNSVRSIKGDAFKGCKNIRTMVIPHTVLSISATAFTGCTVYDAYHIGPHEPAWKVLMSPYTTIHCYSVK